ncbi:protein O-mannosyl-transferase family [Bacteroidota bacterium]
MRINNFKINTDLLFSVSIFTISLIVYIITLCPTVYLGDSSEFVLNSITLGISHSPGYSLYNLLGRVFNLILFPFSDAGTINLLSAFFCSVSSVILFHILLLLTKDRITSLSIALIFAFSFTFWSRATIAEVYSLVWLFMALSIYVSIKWYFSREHKYLYLLSYIAGLGLSLHTTSVIFSFSIILFVLISHIKILTEYRSIIFIILFFLLGLTTYLYLPLRAQLNPPLNIGNPWNWENIEAYFNIAGGYITYSEDSETRTNRLIWLIEQFFTKEFWYFGIMTIIGIFTLIRKNWRLSLTFLSVVFINIYWATGTSVAFWGDLDTYFMPSYLAAIIFLGIGINNIFDFLISKKNQKYKSIMAGIILFMPVVVLVSNFSFNDKSNNTVGYDLGKNIVNNLDKDAIFIGDWDEAVFLLNYFQYQDTTLHNEILPYTYFDTPWFLQYNREHFNDPSILDMKRQLSRVLNKYVGKRPVYLQFNLLADINPEEYKFNHKGTVVELLPKNSTTESSKLFHYFNPEVNKLKFDFSTQKNLEIYNRSLMDYIVFTQLTQSVQNTKIDSAVKSDSERIFVFNSNNNAEKVLTGITYLRESPGLKSRQDIYFINKIEGRISIKQGEFNKAVDLFNRCIGYNPNDSEAYAKRGDALLGLDKKDETIRDWEKSLQLNPRNNNLRQKLLSLKESSISR